MKNKICIIAMFIMTLFLTGCQNNPETKVQNYLDLYKNLDVKILSGIDDIVDMENLSDENKKTYKDIFKRQYLDMNYKIVDSLYEGDEAFIKVQITVYDLYKAQKESNIYLANNPEDFYDEDGVYDADKFIKFKLNNMKTTTEKIEYTIDFYLSKDESNWIISELSNSDLEKIHGIYDYESE